MHHREQFRQYLADSPFLSAPMADYSDRAFREIMRDMGARLIYTEMYSSEAISRGDPKTDRLMDFAGETAPVIVQLLGSRPDLMAESARVVERLGAQGIDINMGCPAKKIVKGGSGAALAENFPRATAVVRAVRAATALPVTVKMRWQADGRALRLAAACESEGADAIALHARTRAQAYSGTAHWPWIAEMKRALGIPLIGNGDVLTAADAWRMRHETGCDAVMVGRGLVGNAWLMREAMAALREYPESVAQSPSAVNPQHHVAQSPSAVNPQHHVAQPPSAVDSQHHMAQSPSAVNLSTNGLPNPVVFTAEGGCATSDAPLLVDSPMEPPSPSGPPNVSSAPSDSDRLALCWRHGQLMFEHKGAHGLIEFRKHVARYILGMPGARAARPELMQILTLEQLLDALRRHFPVAFGEVNR